MDLSSVHQELLEIASEWKTLASHACLPPEVIESLESDGSTEQDALREVLRHWFQNVNEVGGEMTWSLLLKSVQDVDQGLAERLREKHTPPAAAAGEESRDEAVGEDKEAAMEVAEGEGEGGGHDSASGGATNAHVFLESWSKLPKEEIIDRVKGMIYGQAIGDALGLGTEFMSKKEAQSYYKNGIKSYEEIVQDFHRSRWERGDWTDDTDQVSVVGYISAISIVRSEALRLLYWYSRFPHLCIAEPKMLLIMLMLIERNGGVDQRDLAARLNNWRLHGFEEFGDIGGMGIGMTVSSTLRHPKFLQEPAVAAKEIWEGSGRYLAANGAIMRTAILGALQFNDIPAVVANTADIARVTHADPRCSASCVAVTTAIALMLQGKYNLSKKDQLKKLVDEATEEGVKLLELKDQVKEMKKFIGSSLKDLDLSHRPTIGYTFKALGAGFYGLRKGTDFRKTITEVIMEAGDADSNAAVCGALMGCKLGFRALPQDLLEFKFRSWLDAHVDKFLKTIGLA